MNNNIETLISWKELIVTDNEGATAGKLGEMVQYAPGNIELNEDGSVRIMEDFFLSIDGEEPSSDIPSNVDWSGLKETLAAITGADEE